MKLTNELISAILRKKVYDCDREEVEAILKLVGCQVKEWHHKDAAGKDHHDKSVCFEIHHRQFFMIEVSGDNSSRIVSYGNEWFMENGIAMPTDNFGVVLHVVLNFLLPKLPIDYAGPQYTEREWEYKSMEEMQALLSYLQDELGVVMEEVNAAEQQNKKSKRSEKPEVHLGVSKVADLVPGMVGGINERNMKILLEAVSQVPTQENISGVRSEDGSRVWGSEMGNVLEWEDFLQLTAKVGNINM